MQPILAQKLSLFLFAFVFLLGCSEKNIRVLSLKTDQASIQLVASQSCPPLLESGENSPFQFPGDSIVFEKQFPAKTTICIEDTCQTCMNDLCRFTLSRSPQKANMCIDHSCKNLSSFSSKRIQVECS